jgi:hypothetical protein
MFKQVQAVLGGKPVRDHWCGCRLTAEMKKGMSTTVAPTVAVPAATVTSARRHLLISSAFVVERIQIPSE